jgi:hypothetical protein
VESDVVRLGVLTTEDTAKLSNTPINVTIKVGCDRWGTSRSKLYQLAGEGKVIFRKIGRRTVVDVASADAYFANLPPAKIKAPPPARVEAAE